MKDYKATTPTNDGYKSYTSQTTKICAHCKQKYTIYTGEIEYIVKIPTGAKNKKSNKVKHFCSYTCKQRYIKENLDPKEQY